MNETYEGTPGWVKTLLVIGVILGVLLLLVLIFGGGRHGPGGHVP
jgi:hypothetical protein